jgi:DNA repair protein RecO (recombination protein O)
MRLTTEGLVLKSTECGEADLIVGYATPDRGLIEAFAKSPRKIKSRFGSSLEPLTHARIAVIGKEGATLPRLVQSDIIYSFSAVRDDFSLLMSAARIVELFRRFVLAGEARPRKFGLLLATLHALETSRRVALLSLAFTVKILWMSGYAPRLDTCGRCYEGIDENVPAVFSPADGTVVCPRCGGDGYAGRVVDGETAAFIRGLRDKRLAELIEESDDQRILESAENLLDAHLGNIPVSAGG